MKRKKVEVLLVDNIDKDLEFKVKVASFEVTKDGKIYWNRKKSKEELKRGLGNGFR